MNFRIRLSLLVLSLLCNSCLIAGAASCEDDENCIGSEQPLTDTESEHPLVDRYQTWVYSLCAAFVIGLSGIVPLVFIPVETGLKLKQAQGGGKLLKLLLSFAVGGLLGDVFLHLLPEAWDHLNSNFEEDTSSSHTILGLWVLCGMFSFVVIEIMFTASEVKKMVPMESSTNAAGNCYTQKDTTVSNYAVANGCVYRDKLALDGEPLQRLVHQNGHSESKGQSSNKASESFDSPSNIHITGYLNLMANSIDNFTHGLAVAASFLVSCKMGVLTTFAILIHEIPHEIGDFAILLKSGFHPWAAAKAQISTATIGIFGVIVALSAESIDKIGVCTSWILPFTAGGFLNIALVNVLPDLLKEKDPWESMKQLFCLCAGISVMAFVNLLV